VKKIRKLIEEMAKKGSREIERRNSNRGKGTKGGVGATG